MSITTYKGFTIQVVGLSHYIYRPGTDPVNRRPLLAHGYAQSFAAAKRWINQENSR